MADLNEYEVGVRGHTTKMQLSDDEAQAFKDQGVSVKKAGKVAPAERQDVVAPPYGLDDEGNALPEDKAGVRRRARTPRNKSVK